MNASELVVDALEHADKRAPDVKKAALLRIARVQLKTDPTRARATLDAGLAAPVELAESEFGFGHLSRLAIAAVAPQLLVKLAPLEGRAAFHNESFQIANLMVKHGHIDYLRTYMLKDASLPHVPMSGFPLLMQAAQDDDERRLYLRRAAEVWLLREDRLNPGPHRMQFSHLCGLFRRHWRILPREEAQTALAEVIDQLLAKPDQAVTGRVCDVNFSSTHALDIFNLFDLLLELDPERAERLAATHSELAVALKRYPKGQRTILEEAEAQRVKARESEPAKGGFGFGVGGSSADFEYGMSILRARESKDFSEPLKHAASSYGEDSDRANPNRAAKEFWPSSVKYKSIFHLMAKELGDPVAPELARIKHIDLRLLAQIEFAAGLNGLPELTTMTIPHKQRPWQ
jgi:hypothetical protein